VPQRLHDMTVPNSVHFQQVGQQTFITTAHSQQRRAASCPPFVDGAETVTGSAQIEIFPAGVLCADPLGDSFELLEVGPLMTSQVLREGRVQLRRRQAGSQCGDTTRCLRKPFEDRVNRDRSAGH